VIRIVYPFFSKDIAMSNVQEQIEAIRRFAEASERQAERMKTVIAHLKQHGQSVEAAEQQMSQSHTMARAYRARRDELEAQLIAGQEEAAHA
jgi:hypothetical protein